MVYATSGYDVIDAALAANGCIFRSLQRDPITYDYVLWFEIPQYNARGRWVFTPELLEDANPVAFHATIEQIVLDAQIKATSN